MKLPRRIMAAATCLILLSLVGCRVNSDGNHEIMLNPLIGLIGMAVDGDDKDDYASYMEADCCECDGKCCCD